MFQTIVQKHSVFIILERKLLATVGGRVCISLSRTGKHNTNNLNIYQQQTFQTTSTVFNNTQLLYHAIRKPTANGSPGQNGFGLFIRRPRQVGLGVVERGVVVATMQTIVNTMETEYILIYIFNKLTY